MRVVAFPVLMIAVLLAGAPVIRASAAEGEGATGLKKALPDWFNKQAREYYTMPLFVVPVIQGNDVTRQVSFLVTVETMGTVNREKVMGKRPQLQDGFLRDLYGFTAIKPDTEVYDTDVIKVRLRRTSDRLVGDGVIDDILISITYDRRVAPTPAGR
ncbi:MAG: hypothetical protein ACM30I_14535 [Gemmatimonas sp.]